MVDRFRRSRARPLIYGHRGASALATENTIQAIEAALADGADGVEIDVQLAACGAVVVFHDDTLARLAQRPERIDALTLRELRAANFIGGGTVSTLAEVIEAAGPMIVNVEIKTPGPHRAGAVTEATLAVIRRLGVKRRDILISSFDPTILLRLARRDSSLTLGLLFHHQQQLPLRRAWLAPMIGARALHPFEGMIDARRLERWRRASRVINTWTFDDPDRVRRLDALGVDGIIANDPGRARRAL